MVGCLKKSSRSSSVYSWELLKPIGKARNRWMSIGCAMLRKALHVRDNEERDSLSKKRTVLSQTSSGKTGRCAARSLSSHFLENFRRDSFSMPRGRSLETRGRHLAGFIVGDRDQIPLTEMSTRQNHDWRLKVRDRRPDDQ